MMWLRLSLGWVFMRATTAIYGYALVAIVCTYKNQISLGFHELTSVYAMAIVQEILL